MRRAVEHRALMAIAIGDLGRGQHLDRSPSPRSTAAGRCTRTRPLAAPARRVPRDDTGRRGCGRRCGCCTITRSPTATCAARRSPSTTATVLFGGFGNAEYGATDAQLQSDIAQLLVTTTALYDAETAVRAAIDVFGKDAVLTASRRLTKAAVPKRIRESVTDAGAVISAARATRSSARPAPTRSRPRRSPGSPAARSSSWCCSVALVYVAYPFISTVPTFFSELRNANWWWALLGLTVSALTYVGAAAALWACADGLVSFRNLTIMQVANTFAATTTPAGVGGLALSTRFLQKGGLGAHARHRGGGAAAVGAGDHPRHAADLLQRRRGRVGRPVALRPVPRCCT